MSTLFISHSSADSTAAREMAEWLERHGHHSLFLDFDVEHGIPAGRDWERELYRNLRTCQAMIVLCSEHSMTSCWCLAEMSHARALGKRIFPVRIACCTLRPQLAELQVIDLVKDPETGYKRLRQGLASVFDWDRRRPPYPGLLVFEEADAAIFFGRDAEIQQALDRLHQRRRFGGPRLLLFLGASGSGKSSLVRAGIVPRLRTAPETWAVIGPIRPRERPFDEFSTQLARGLAAEGVSTERIPAMTSPAESAAQWLPTVHRELRMLPGREHVALVLIVDQLEELLTNSVQAEQFMRVLRPALHSSDVPILVIATLRSDFLGALQEHPAWRDVPLEPLTVEPLSVGGFAAVIEGPAELAGLELETGLVGAMVADTATEDALPLLAFTLRELWEQGGDDGRLTLAEYRDRLGGLHGSVARAAEAVLTAAALTPEQEQALRAALLTLVRLDDEGRYTRQMRRWEDLPAASHPLLERFVKARLLIAGSHDGARTLEVAHESLFRVWHRLNQWLEADREALRIRDGLHRAASEWEDGGRPAELLVHRGSRLDMAEALADESLVLFADIERRYLQACREQRDAEFAESRRRERVKRRWIAATGLTLLCGVIGLSWFAWSLHQQEQITRQGLADLHWVNGVRARDRDDSPLKASHHFMRAAELAVDPGRAASAYWAANRVGHGLQLAAAADTGPGLVTAAFEAAGETVRLWGSDGSGRAWSVGDGAAEPTLPRGRRLVQTVSPAGMPWHTRIVVYGEDHRAEIRDRRSGALLIETPPAVERLWIGGADEATAVSVHRGGEAWVWDLAHGERLGALPHAAGVDGVAFSPQGARLLFWTRDGEAVLWHLDTATVAARYRGAGEIIGGALGARERDVALWSRDGRLWLPALDDVTLAPAEGGRCSGRAIGAQFLVATARLLVWNHGACGTARLWDPEAQLPVGPVIRHAEELAPPAIGRARFVTWSPNNGPARLWHSTTGQAVATLAGPVTGASFGADEGLLVTWGGSEARLWASITGNLLGLPLRHPAAVMGAMASDDGQRVLSWAGNGSLRLWRVHAPTAAAAIEFPTAVLDAALVPGEARIQAVTLDGYVHAWSPNDGTVERWLLDRGIVRAAFAPDGHRLLTAGPSGDVRIWSWEEAAFQALAAPGATAGDAPVADVVWNSGSDRLLFWGEQGCTAWLWRVGMARVVPLEHGGEADGDAECRLRGAAFDDDGSRLLTWGEDRRLRLWDVEAREPVSLWAFSDGPLIRSAGIDAAGERLLVATDDGGVTLSWQDRRTASVSLHHDDVRGARLHAGTQRILSWGGDSVRIWDLAAATHLANLAHQGNVVGAAFARDGERVLTWQSDGSIRLWDAVGGHPLTPALHGAGRSSFAIDSDFGPSAIRLLVATDDRATLWQWPALGAPPSRPVRRQEVLTGSRLTAFGEVEALSAVIWRQLAADPGD
ncbi:nSTAND1 domain-containing NTPase [Litchfieldella rifensis]|uniref:TIR domain-containing protein n=1 Tax=Litchfieldella rifensis TaxID=762643 RepID=A0ABV7LQT3_9GAMM